MSALAALRGKLIVSCQAWDDDAFYGPGRMALFARAAVEGGAAGIRANGPADVREIKAATGVPVIAIQKRMGPDGRILITPSFEDAADLVRAGADMVALDCTTRGQRFGALERLARIRRELKAPVAADIATVEEALAAEAAGAEFVLSTMRGYTDDTAQIRAFDPEFIAELTRRVGVPVIAEGRIWSPEEARAAIEAGAFAVVVGSAITRPRDIAARFAGAVASAAARSGCYLGIDLGGTNLKSGLVLADGAVLDPAVEPTVVDQGRDGVLAQLAATAARLRGDALRRRLTPLAAGIASPGWPDPETGVIVHATANLPDWTGARVAGAVESGAGVPVFVENDANALAVGEHCFGAARGLDTFLCVTIGTGIGGGCFANGELLRGARFQGNQLGHVRVEADGLPCTCGARGCLEQYANEKAMSRYGGGRVAREIIAAARGGDPAASAAIVKVASYLALGLAPAVQLLDPERIVLSGGGAQENALLADAVQDGLSSLVPRWRERPNAVWLSALGYHGGVSGAAAVARMRMRSGPAAAQRRFTSLVRSDTG